MKMNINSSQRFCLAATATLIILVLFLHNPTDGYNTGTGYATNDWVRKAECSDAEYEELSAITYTINLETGDGKKGATEFLDKLQRKKKLTEKCLELQNGYRFVERDVWDWYSEGAALNWLASLGHLALTLIVTLILGCIWFAMFHAKGRETKNSSTTQ